MSTDMFDIMRGDDGYRIEAVAIGDSVVALHVGMYADGLLVNYVTDVGQPRQGAAAAPELFRWDKPTPADRSECNRLFYLLEAMIRFLNTGGTWEQIDAACAKLHMFASGPLVFPGYSFHESSLNRDGDWEHVFLVQEPRPDGMDVVVWYEGEFVTRCTVAEYRRIKDDSPVDDDEEEEDDSGEG